jgi:hypothetical protein
MPSPNDSELLLFSETWKYSKICFSVPNYVKSVGWKTRMLVTSGWYHGVLDSQLSYHTYCINTLEINLTTLQQILEMLYVLVFLQPPQTVYIHILKFLISIQNVALNIFF